MDFCDGDVEQVARQLRTEFVRRKRMIAPNFRLKSTRHGAVWARTAEMLLKEGITEIVQFIEAQFDAIKDPYPNMIVGHNALARYKTFKKGSSKLGRMDLHVNTQMHVILSRANRGFDMKKFLTEPAERLCPVLAYGAALLLGLQDVADYLKPEAEEYAQKHPEVLVILKNKYPRVPCPIS